jgi:PAS domain S-box-containing protein
MSETESSPNDLDKLREIERHLIDPEFMMKLFEDFTDAIIVVNSEGKIQLANKQAELLFGFPRSELFDRQIEMLMPLAFRDQHAHYRALYAKEPVARQMGRGRQIMGAHKDGHEIRVEVVLNPIILTKGLVIVATVRR